MVLHFSADGKPFENLAFQKRWHHDEFGIFLTIFSQTQFQNDHNNRLMLSFEILPA